MKTKLIALAIALVVMSLQVHAQDSSTDVPLILSDTYGYDFGSYMTGVTTRVRLNWYALMPEIALKGEKGRVVLTFTIVRDGKVQDPRVRLSSGNDVLDRAAFAAITSSSPFPPLPGDFRGEQLVLQLAFMYNLKSQ
jgi:TonB family protein